MINRFVIVFLCFVANPGCARADEPQISAQAIFADDAAEDLPLQLAVVISTVCKTWLQEELTSTQSGVSA
jgi:hypothetical protein